MKSCSFSTYWRIVINQRCDVLFPVVYINHHRLKQEGFGFFFGEPERCFTFDQEFNDVIGSHAWRFKIWLIPAFRQAWIKQTEQVFRAQSLQADMISRNQQVAVGLLRINYNAWYYIIVEVRLLSLFLYSLKWPRTGEVGHTDTLVFWHNLCVSGKFAVTLWEFDRVA